MEPLKFFTFTHTVMKNLFSKPATTSYPFKPASYPERARGHVEINTEACIGCGLCMRSCPSNAIAVDRAAESWQIERFDCVQCGNCVNMCPKKCLRIVPGYTEPDVAKKRDSYAITVPKPAAKPVAKPAAGTPGERPQ